MESVWWVFKTMFEKGLVYRGYKVMPYSCPCGTPLSNFEAGLNYKDVNDPAAVVSFPLVEDPEVLLLAWTTTPWTLPSNLALCVNLTFEYVKIRDKTRGDKVFILLGKRLVQLFPELRHEANQTDEFRATLYDVLEVMTGDKLVGLHYQPLFNYFVKDYGQRAFRVVADNYVTEEGGTGIVHQAPAFGEDDYRVCMANGIVEKGADMPCPVDANGCFTAEVDAQYQGKMVKDADNDICTYLKAQGRLISKETYMHSYPFCWRSDTPLIYKAVPSWFVTVEKLRSQLLANNAETYWVPSFVKEKRFHNWLAEAKDWAISRNRFWGTPIPLWVSDDLEEIVAIGSIEELQRVSGRTDVTDLHKEFVDDIKIPSRQGKGMLTRVDEVFDCWFESGSMPYAQLHYPFENADRFETGFPADFIAEGIDQTRGWFYTLMVIATCLFDKPAFKNLIVNGLVLAADGKKMSKRLQNYPDPMKVVNEYGADAMRLYLINSPVVRGDNLRFQEEGVSEVLRGVMIPWYQTFRFFAQCVDRWEVSSGVTLVANPEVAKSSTNDVDVWILAAVQSLVGFVHQEMQAYRLYTVVPRLIDFVDQLSKWYVRLNRPRMKGEAGEEEAFIGLQVLCEVFKTMTVIMAPFTPFFTDFLYKHLRPMYPTTDTDAQDVFGRARSVHFVMLPQKDPRFDNPLAVARFQVLQTAVTLARMAREKRRIRNNLPLKSVTVVLAKPEDVDALEYLKPYFLAEVNAWDVVLSSEWTKLCSLKITPNFAVFGKRVGDKNKAIVKQLNALTTDQIHAFMAAGEVTLEGFLLKKDEDLVVKLEFKGDNKKFEAVGNDEGNVLVAVDTTTDEDMFTELRARAIQGAIQKLRKASGLVVADKVEMYYDVTGLKEAERVVALQQIDLALTKHNEMCMKRLKQLPRHVSCKSVHARVIAEDTMKDQDIVTGKGSFVLYLTKPCVEVREDAVKALVAAAGLPDEASVDHATKMLVMYLHTVHYARLVNAEQWQARLDGVSYTLVRGVHYLPSVTDNATAEA
jgi:isoleucyl-tRNA synthetase